MSMTRSSRKRKIILTCYCTFLGVSSCCGRLGEFAADDTNTGSIALNQTTASLLQKSEMKKGEPLNDKSFAPNLSLLNGTSSGPLRPSETSIKLLDAPLSLNSTKSTLLGLPPLSEVNHPYGEASPPMPTTTDTQHIVGGDIVAPGTFPFFTDFGPCGAALIHSDILITAAHCNVITSRKVYVNSHYSPHSGGEGLGPSIDSSKGDMEERHILARRIHPDYNNRATKGHDIMLLKLDSPSNHTPVAINSDPDRPIVDRNVIAIGHGVVDTATRESSSLLRRVSLSTYSNEECHDIYSSMGHFDVIRDSMLCTGTLSGGRDSCQGDSGGCVLERQTSASPSQKVEFALVGIVSFGISCALPNVPAVNTRVSSYSQWIQKQICDLSENRPSDCPPIPENAVAVRVNVVLGREFQQTSWSIRRNEDGLVVFSSRGYSPGLTSERVYLTPETYVFALVDATGGASATYELTADKGEKGEVLIKSGGGYYSDIGPHTFILTPPEIDVEEDEGERGGTDGASTASCHDISGDGFYVNKMFGAQSCTWLKQNRGWSRVLCRPGSRVYETCAETCGTCSTNGEKETSAETTVECEDSRTGLFTLDGRGGYTCRWLSSLRRDAGTMKRICDISSGNAREVCRKSCQTCGADEVERKYAPRAYDRHIFHTRKPVDAAILRHGGH